MHLMLSMSTLLIQSMKGSNVFNAMYVEAVHTFCTQYRLNSMYVDTVDTGCISIEFILFIIVLRYVDIVDIYSITAILL